jgi:hypothetical protein
VNKETGKGAIRALQSARPSPLFEAVIHNETVEVRCVCGNIGLFQPHGLWWRFYLKRWPYRYGEMRRRFYCTRCLRITGNRVRPDHVGRTTERAIIQLPMPMSGSGSG